MARTPKQPVKAVAGTSGVPPHKDNLEPLLCLKCMQFGHPAKTCQATGIACMWCGETGHKVKDCPEKKSKQAPTCANCKAKGKEGEELRHCAGSRVCPQHLEMMAGQRKRTRYV